MTCNIPNTFVQTEVEVAVIGKRIIMKIRGLLVNILLEMDYNKYGPFVMYKREKKILCIVMLQSLFFIIRTSENSVER